MKTQYWKCDNCGIEGSTEYEDHAGIWEVHQNILRDHRIASPECEGGYRIRVVANP